MLPPRHHRQHSVLSHRERDNRVRVGLDSANEPQRMCVQRLVVTEFIRAANVSAENGICGLYLRFVSMYLGSSVI